MLSSGTAKFKGYIAECRLYENFSNPVYGSSPAALDTGKLSVFPSTQSQAIELLNAPGIWTPNNKSFSNPMSKLYDTYYGGKGRISGSTQVKGTPNYPVSRRVRLIREVDGVMIREQWSDPVTGAYSFDNIDATQKYTVITYDYQHSFRAVVADNLTPDLMP